MGDAARLRAGPAWEHEALTQNLGVALRGLQAPWLLMIETDYVWMRPLQAPPAQDPASRPMAFPFSYIAPQTPSIEAVMRRMYPPERGPVADVPGTGPAPVLMRFQEWLEVGSTNPATPPSAC